MTGKKRVMPDNCLIEGYEDDCNNEVNEETITDNSNKNSRVKRLRLDLNQEQFGKSSNNSSSFFSLIEPEQISSSRSHQPSVLEASVGSFHLPQPQRSLFGLTGVSSVVTTKRDFPQVISETARQESGEDRGEEELLDLSHSTQPPPRLSSLFTLPGDEVDDEEPNAEECSQLNSATCGPVENVEESKPSLWSRASSKRTSEVAGPLKDYGRLGVSDREGSQGWNDTAITLNRASTIEEVIVPKGREWKALTDMENYSASSITLTSDDLRDPNWKLNCEQGQGRLRKKQTVEGSSWNNQKGASERIYEPSRRQRSKHQINWLAQDAANREFDVLERSAQQQQSRRQAAMKYGW